MAGEGERNLDDVQAFTRAATAGEMIFTAGEAGGDLFIVQGGQVDLLDAGDGAVLSSIGPGGIFGEWSFFEGKPREASARAAVATELLQLDRATFDRITAEAPQIAASMAHQLAHRIGELRESIAPGVPARAVASEREPEGEPRLVVEGSSKEFPLEGLEEAIVGRPDRGAGFVPQVDLSALDTKRTLSRRHARIVRRGRSVFVTEEKVSRNGTFVNGERLAEGAEVQLRDGDRVQFGLVKLVVRWR